MLQADESDQRAAQALTVSHHNSPLVESIA